MDFRQIANANSTSPSDEDDLRLFKSPTEPELASWILRIKRDDPEFKFLHLDDFSDLGLDATVYGRLGHLLGRNHHLEDLEVWGSVGDVPGLLAGLRDNRHIQRLSFFGVDNIDTEHLDLLVPFLSQNPNLQVVWFQHCGLGQDSINILSNSLLRRSLDTLEDLILDGNKFGDIDLDELVRALSRSKSLTELSLENNGIGRRGCASLVRLLETQESSLKHLSLDGNSIDDESAIMLADSLAKNAKLEELSLSRGNRIGKAGWLGMLKCVCNNSIIEDVEESNHTLHFLWHFHSAQARRAHEKSVEQSLGINNGNLLRVSLKVNGSANKMLVARHKIIWSHVLGSLNVGDSDIAASFMPRILSWITSGSDDTGTDLVDFHDPPIPEAELDAVRPGAIFRILRSRPAMLVCGNEIATNGRVKADCA